MSTNTKSDQRDEFDNDMICPKCRELGQKSLLFSFAASTIIPFQYFWDEKGKYHCHSSVLEYFMICDKDHISKKVFLQPPDRSRDCGTCRENRGFVLDEDGVDSRWSTNPIFKLEFVRDATPTDHEYTDSTPESRLFKNIVNYLDASEVTVFKKLLNRHVKNSN